MGAALSAFSGCPTAPDSPKPFELMQLPREVRQNILLIALTETYKKDMTVMSVRYWYEEDSQDWDSRGNGELPLQDTYNLVRKLSSAFTGNGLITDKLEFVLRKVVAKIDVHIGWFHGDIDDAVTRLAMLCRSMVMLSLEDVHQEDAMEQEWCDDWEWLILEWVVYHHHKMDSWKMRDPKKSLWTVSKEDLAAIRSEG